LKQAQSPNSIGNARDWAPILRRYREPDHVRSVLEVFITAVPFVLLWVLMWASLSLSYWLSLIIAVPAAGFLVRLFMIQHDCCGHGAFFRHRWANDWLGRAIGVVTVTPYDQWRRSHAIHHASSGNLERRDIGDIDTLTVREYLGSSRWGASGTVSIAILSLCSASVRPTFPGGAQTADRRTKTCLGSPREAGQLLHCGLKPRRAGHRT